MSWLRTVRDELIGLFVDDGRFAASIVGWIVLCALVLPRVSLPAATPPILLFAGLAVILVHNAARRAREGRQP
ncbi:MAG: hypothetical protein JSR21_11125 [Proteobacteria bacterium]|nr:hypothetical protein [Pseudomonadota bacterium]